MSVSSDLSWHYTIGWYYPLILKDQEIKCIPTNGAPKSERPVVWLSMDQHYEPTAAKAAGTSGGRVLLLSMQETAQHFGGLYRIGVDPNSFELHDFVAFRRLSGISRTDAQELIRVGREEGAIVANWRVSFVPIRSKSWRKVQRWNDIDWIDVGFERTAAV